MSKATFKLETLSAAQAREVLRVMREEGESLERVLERLPDIALRLREAELQRRADKLAKDRARLDRDARARLAERRDALASELAALTPTPVGPTTGTTDCPLVGTRITSTSAGLPGPEQAESLDDLAAPKPASQEARA